MAVSLASYMNCKTCHEFNYVWVINNLSDYSYRDDSDDNEAVFVVTSPIFLINQNCNSWKLELDFNRSLLRIILEIVENEDELIKNENFFKIQIEDIRTYEVRLTEMTIIKGKLQYEINDNDFFYVVEYNSYDSLNISCSLTIHNKTTDKFYVDKFNLNKGLSTDLRNLWKNEKDCDITFIIGDQQIKAHKLMLQCRSIVFEKMLEVNMLEKHTNQIKIVDVRPEIFNKMLEFIYTDNVEEKLDIDDACDLLNLAEKYQLESLKQLCGKLLFTCMSENNALDIYLIFKQYVMEELSNRTKEYITRYKMKILKAKNEEFYHANKEALKLLLELMF